MRPPRAAISPARALPTATGRDRRMRAIARALSLKLALASLDLDAQKYDDVVAAATALQSEAASRDAVGPESQAWTLLARAHLAQAATQKALEDARARQARGIEPFALAIEQRIAHGEVLALLDQPDDGLKELDDARADADKRGFPGLVLAARLARLEVLTATSSSEAAAEAEGAGSRRAGARVRSHRRPRRHRRPAVDRGILPAMPDCQLCGLSHDEEQCPKARTGQRLDKYIVGPLLGVGGIAAVYAARHPVLARDIAVKILHKRFAKDRELAPRFVREARETAALGHPAFVARARCRHDRGRLRVHRDGELEGRDLYTLRKTRGPLAPERVVAIAIAVLDALAALHARGVDPPRSQELEHLPRAGGRGGEQVKLLDLGFAKVDDELAAHVETSSCSARRSTSAPSSTSIRRRSMRAPICSRSAS